MSLLNIFGPTSTGASRQRWVTLAWLFLLTAINYLDRTNMAVAAPALKDELGLDPFMLGLLFSAFSWSYGLLQIPGGWFLDRMGARNAYTLSLFFWSLFTVFMGWGYSFVILFIIRLLVGMAEAPAFPANSRIASMWFPTHERGTATAVYTAGEFVGLAFLTPVLAYILHAHGWREIFFFTGIIGILVAFFFHYFYRDPKDAKGLNDIERQYIRDGGGLVDIEPKSGPINLSHIKELFKHRQLIGIYIGQFANTSTMFFFLTWFPTYLMVAKDMPIIKAGFYAAIPYIGALIGVLVGGYWSDTMIKRGIKLGIARKTPIITGLILTMTIMGANFASTPETVIAFMTLAFFGQGMAATIWSTVGDIAPIRSIGLAGGVFNFMGNLAGIITPIVIGAIVSATNNFTGALIFVGAIAFLGVLSLLFLVGDMHRITPKE